MSYKSFSFIVLFWLGLIDTGAQIPDSITVSIVHGHRVKKEFRKAYKALHRSMKSVGGLKGGHVEIHMDTLAYGFTDTPQSKIPHVFAHNKKKNNGLFQKISKKEWSKKNKSSKVTFIMIPISEEQYLNLIQNYETNIKQCPYDFALFGMRCASSAYQMLNEVTILEPLKHSKTALKIFHPRAFRKFVIPWALGKGYPVRVQEGDSEKKWDK